MLFLLLIMMVNIILLLYMARRAWTCEARQPLTINQATENSVANKYGGNNAHLVLLQHSTAFSCCRRRRGEAQHSFPRCGIDGWKDLERRISKRGFERKCSPQHTAVGANRWNVFPLPLLKCTGMLSFARIVLVWEARASHTAHAQQYQSWWNLE